MKEKLKHYQAVIKARVLNTLQALKALYQEQGIVITSPDNIYQLKLFKPFLTMKFYKGLMLMERTYEMPTRFQHWKTKNFHSLIIIICGFGFGINKQNLHFLKEMQELEELEELMKSSPTYRTPARIKEYNDRLKALENQE